MASKKETKKTGTKAASKAGSIITAVKEKATRLAAKLPTKLPAKTVSKSKANSIEPIKKQYLKSRPVCKVTFRLPKLAAPSAKDVRLVGDFNEWNTASATALKKLSNGEFTVTVELETGREYGFKYLIDGQKWENHWNADKYVHNAHGSDDSVVIV